VKQIVSLHGGEVEARSNGRGFGSMFVVRLPAVHELKAQSAEVSAPSVSVNPAARKILLVDDNEDARVLLADMLVAIGHAVHGAADGYEALDVLADFHPDVAILDIGLPGMDGYELAARIRQRSQHDIQLIALSGYGLPNDIARSERAGFDAHLVKPVDIDRLVEVIGARRAPDDDGG
jgi:CheY-like chemotaxis protein